MGSAGSGGEAGREGRAGALVLSVLASPLSPQILGELSRGPRRFSELWHQVGSPPQTTLRTRLRELAELGVIARRRRTLLPGAAEYELTGLAGRELLFVVTTLEGWLASAPQAALGLSSEVGRAAIADLVESWSSAMLPNGAHEHAAYDAPDWLRKGMGPITAAARWERRHIPNAAAPLRPTDVEAGFLLAIPLLKPAPELSGSCRLGVEFRDGTEGCLAGVTVEVAGGRVVSCTARLESSPSAWATGPPEAWLRTAVDADPNRLELGGDRRLVRGLVDGLNQVLFGPARPLPPQP